MNGLALCSGVGGLELGVKAVVPEYRTVCHVEGEAYAAACLVARMDEGWLDPAPVWSDLITFDGYPWRGVVDIVTAGYPCQPFSVAGRRKGEKDPRHLWPHVARIVDEVRPGVVFCENVPGHVSMGLEAVASDLRGMGYVVQAGLFSAAQVGAPHRRQRLFLLAADSDFFLRKQPRRRGGAHGEDAATSGVDGEAGSLADSDRQGQQQPKGRVGEVRGRSGNGGRWTFEPDVGRVAHGVPARVDRLRALGNAVVPQTAALAFRTLSAGILPSK